MSSTLNTVQGWTAVEHMEEAAQLIDRARSLRGTDVSEILLASAAHSQLATAILSATSTWRTGSTSRLMTSVEELAINARS